MGSRIQDFGLIKENKVFSVEGVHCYSIFIEVIMISVTNVLFEMSLNGYACLSDIGFPTGAGDLVDSLKKKGFVFTFDTSK